MNKSRIQNFALLLLRVSFSGFLLTHGIPKLIKLLSNDMEFADPLGLGAPVSLILAILGEVIFPILIIIGFKTRWMVIPVIITMAVAAFVHHAQDPFVNRELSMLYLIGFVVVGLLGPGKFSYDRR